MAFGLVLVTVFLVLSCVFTRPMITQGNHATFNDPYDPTFGAWTLAWDIKTLQSNPFNLFNANIYYPSKYTLAYSELQLTTAVMAMPVLAVTGNPIQTANLMLIFNFFLAALGAYLLTNHLMRNRAAAFVAGIVYAFAAPRLAHMGHLQLSAAGWIPLCLLFLHKYSEDGGWKNAALVGLFLVLQTLATWYYGIMLSVAIIVFLIVRLVMNRKGFTLRWTMTLLIALLVAGLLISPFAIPYLKIQSKDPKFVRTVKEVDQFSADVRDFAIAPGTNFLWGKLTAGLRKTTTARGGSEVALFPGLLPLLLGFAGALLLFLKGKGKERFYVRFYVTLLAVSAVLCLGTRLSIFGHSLGITMPYDLLYYAFPGFKVIRVPARFVILMLLALAVLSAFAVRAILTWLAARKNVGLNALALVVIVGLLLVDLMSVSLPMYPVPLKAQFPAVYYWLKDQPGDSPTVEIPLANYNPKTTFKWGLQYEETWLGREPLRTYFSTLHWKKLLNGYSGFIPASYYDAVKATANFPSKEAIAFLKKEGVKYIIVHGSELDPATRQRVFDRSLENNDLQPLKVFGSDYVYRIR